VNVHVGASKLPAEGALARLPQLPEVSSTSRLSVASTPSLPSYLGVSMIWPV